MPTPPDPAKALTHGLSLRAGASGHSTLYAVGHQRARQPVGHGGLGGGIIRMTCLAEYAGRRTDEDQIALALPPDVPPAPAYPYSLYRVKAQKLNVRLHPWTGESVPQVVRQLAQGAQVQVFGIYKPEGMTYGWGALSPDSNEWVNMHYLDRLAGPAQASPGWH